MKRSSAAAIASIFYLRSRGVAVENTVAPSHDYEGISPNVGDTATVTPGTWTGSPTLTYQWRRDGVDIGGETGLTYEFVDADFGLTVDFIEIPNGDTDAAVASAATGAVVADLTANLMAYWSLNEASGTRNDSHGANHLTDNNTVTQAAGKVGSAASFLPANSETLSIADNAALSTGDIAFTIAGWMYIDTALGNYALLGKWGSSNQEYCIYYNHTNNVPNGNFIFGVSTTGSNSVFVQATTHGAASLGTWYFVVAWHDPTANTLSIQINNGAVDSVSHSGGVRDGTAAMFLGGLTASVFLHRGRLDEIGFWKRLLTASERTILYNGGAGCSYSMISGGA